MGGHYSSRVQRYSPTSSNLYSQNMFIIFKIEHSNRVSRRFNTTKLQGNKGWASKISWVREWIQIDTATGILRTDQWKVEVVRCLWTIIWTMEVFLLRAEIRYCPLMDQTVCPEIRVMSSSTNQNSHKSTYSDLKCTRQRLCTQSSRDLTIS